METGYLVLSPGKPAETRHVDWPEQPGFGRMRELVKPLLDGADLEHVTVLYEGTRADMFVDEIGALKPLPRNEAATAIYRANWLAQHPDAEPESLPAIYGTAVLFLRPVWF